MQVAKWGNSLAVRLPAALVQSLGLKEGDQIDIEAAKARKLTISKAESTDALFDRLRALRGRAPVGFKFDREEANRR